MSDERVTPFLFEAHERARILRLPAALPDKAALFEALRALPLPDYFGANWDALDDCLSDLSFIDTDVVRLEHADLPTLSADDLQTYVELLADAIEARPAGPRLEVVFPPELEAEVAGLLATARGES